MLYLLAVVRVYRFQQRRAARRFLYLVVSAVVRTGLITAATLNLNEIIEIGCKSEVTPQLVRTVTFNVLNARPPFRWLRVQQQVKMPGHSGLAACDQSC